MAKIRQYAWGHAFDFYYKYAPSGSNELTSGWPNQELGSALNNTSTLNGFINMGFGQCMMSRHTASLSSTQGALPWGSAAADMLWNVLVPSMSGVTQQEQNLNGTSNFITTYTFEYTSASWMYHNWEFVPGSGRYGLTEYPITSSWIAYEPKLINSNNQYKIVREDTAGSGNYFPATIYRDGNNQTLQPYAAPTSFDDSVAQYAYNQLPAQGANSFPPDLILSSLTYGDLSTGSHDGRFYDISGGCGITRASISASLVEWNANKTNGTSIGRNAATAALKKRRLFFPTISSTGSASGPFAAPYAGTEWLAFDLGTPSDTTALFDENGGIYNVKFNLMRDIANDFYPDSGQGSELLVYIFDVKSRLQQSGVASVPGDVGYYPPDNNIVRVKNSPAMSFFNPATGYLVESFNVNVVQYGTNAQLVFEASGSLSTEKYFGCIIDGVQFCKVGVSTDPNLIKPTTTGGETIPEAPPELS